jgi:hypothetical protein
MNVYHCRITQVRNRDRCLATIHRNDPGVVYKER